MSLKKSLVDTGTAFGIFKAELTRWRTYIIRDGGLHFNFVSDPCLLEPIELNFRCVEEAQSQGVLEPVIDPDLSFEMIREMAGFCDHYKIGILSGKKSYTPQQIRDFVAKVQSLGHTSIY